jgi:uncharacterized repeat protein (TIGR01451 family)
VNTGTAGNVITNATTAAAGGHTDPTNTGNDLTETITVANAGHTISKTQISGPNPITAAGQTIGYRISVANAGNVTLTGVVVTDTLLLGTASRTVTSGPTYASGDISNIGQLNVGETWLYDASYVTTQADLDATGSLSNTATIDTTQTNPSTSTAVVTPLTRTPALSILRQANTLGPVSVGNVIGYTYRVTNSGNVTINGVGVTDVHNGFGVDPVPGSETLTDNNPPGGSSDATLNNGQWSVLGPGDVVTFSANYTVIQQDIELLQ